MVRLRHEVTWLDPDLVVYTRHPVPGEWDDAESMDFIPDDWWPQGRPDFARRATLPPVSKSSRLSSLQRYELSARVERWWKSRWRWHCLSCNEVRSASCEEEAEAEAERHKTMGPWCYGTYWQRPHESIILPPLDEL
jgi:hypothetical protein